MLFVSVPGGIVSEPCDKIIIQIWSSQEWEVERHCSYHGLNLTSAVN